MTDYGWPPRMIMRVACAYTGRSRWKIARDARRGLLPIAGRNGRTLVFERAALDAWMVGDADAETSGFVAPQPTTPRTTRPESSRALERLAGITKAVPR